MKIKYLPVALFLLAMSAPSIKTSAESVTCQKLIVSKSKTNYYIMSTLKYIISSNTEWAIEDIDDQDNIYYDLNISSLEFFYIIYDVEEYFDVSFSAHEYAEARYETVYQLYLRIYDKYFN